VVIMIMIMIVAVIIMGMNLDTQWILVRRQWSRLIRIINIWAGRRRTCIMLVR